MKKKLIIIIPIIVAVLTFIGVFYYFNLEDKETSLTVLEKRWIEQNNSTKVNIEVINDLPLYGMNGNGTMFQFLTDFESATGLEFNKLPYSKTGATTSKGYRFRILNNDEMLGNKDLLIGEDEYIAISKDKIKLNKISDFKNKKIGVITHDVGELTYLLKTGTNLTFQAFDTIEEMSKSLDNKTIDMIIVPKIMYLDKTINTDNYFINYCFTEISKKIVLTISDEDTKLNEIMTKYFEKWKKSNYVNTYNKAYLNYYVAENKLNDKTKADLVSKNYIYGYVENAPYEVTIDKHVMGVAGEYVERMGRLTGIDFTYKKYKNMEDLKNAISKGEVDLYFNYDNSNNTNYKATISPFIEKYVVLSKLENSQVISSFESLKNKKVNMIKNNALFSYFKDNSRASIEEYTSLDKITDNDNIIIVDKEIYDYYKNNKFVDYEVLYEDYMTNDYTFNVKNDQDNFYKLFNHIINTNSYYRYRNAGLNSLNISALERTTFEELYLIVLGAVLLPVLILLALYLYFKKKKQVKKVKKEDRRKYSDMLTSLKNRNYLNLKMASWDESEIYPQSIIVIDLNNIKYVNDNYGHEAGDDLIVKAAGILVNAQLENSEIIRTDGNEFLIYLVGYSESQTATYTKKLGKELKELPHGFGAALGFSMITDDIKMIDDAINEATIAMRINKEENK
ncbi:MAG: GGDEF domain-containing protein [Bacilli bacterium]